MMLPLLNEFAAYLGRLITRNVLSYSMKMQVFNYTEFVYSNT